VYPKDPKFIVAILEDHTNDEPKKVANMLCVINAEAGKMDIIVKSNDPTQDFYGPPAFSPNGAHIAWQHWSHPYMPWDQAKIYIADVRTADSTIKFDKQRAVPFPDTDPISLVSLAYPNWSNDQTLIFTSDVSGFINPWKYDISTPKPIPVFSTAVDQDFGYPMWSLHYFPFAVLDEQRALFIGTEDGHDSLYSANLQMPGPPTKLDTGCVVIDGLRSLGKGKDGNFNVVFAGTKADEETKIIYYTVPNPLRASVTNFESAAKEAQPIPKEWISTPTTCALKGYDGDVHVVYYEPRNPNYSGPPDKKPPCIVHVHGGPEWLQPQGLDWTKQYFTSRGWVW
jgi:dipeptidyl aminopeptidase/acylaminoacyl peptidase